MPDHITEPARTLPVTGAYDVVVAGGGIAGVAAAVAAARNGASVCLLERAFGLGGLATIGNVINYLPICDGMGRQVMGGLTEELLRLSVADIRTPNSVARFGRIPECWSPGGDPEERLKTRFRADFNPASYQIVLEQFLLRAGVRLLYDTRVCAAHTDGDTVRHLIVENKSGRSALACATVVDATGDADVCWLAGEETESLDANVLAGWFYTLSKGELKLRGMTNKYSKYATQENAVGPFFRGDDADDVTAQMTGSHALMLEKLAQFREVEGDPDMQIITPPTIPCFRMTRRLVGQVSLAESDMHVWCDDAIGLTGDWRRRGPVWAVPFGAIRAARIRNLTAVGRCMSSDSTVWDATRAIPTCALTGEAAGTASAIAAHDHHGDLHAVPVGSLQAQLKRQGNLLDSTLAEPAAASI